MTWKPKEKELTLEEAIDLAKKELKPFWFKSEPLIAGVKQGEKPQYLAVPLSPKFAQDPWLIVLVDPTDFSGEVALVYAKEWYRRYHTLGVGLLLVMRASYDFMILPEAVRSYLEKKQPAFPCVLDADGTLNRAFSADKLPKALLLQKSLCHGEVSGASNFPDLEMKLQNLLRKTDPGLALLPVFHPKSTPMKDFKNFELGYLASSEKGVRFSPPGFVRGENEIRSGIFNLPRVSQQTSNDVYLFGSWVQEADLITTQDPKALLIFLNTGVDFSIVAGTGSESGSVISVEVDGAPAFDKIAGEDLVLTESGHSEIRVKQSQIYHVLSKLSRDQKQVLLKFQNAHQAPISIYGLRLGF